MLSQTVVVGSSSVQHSCCDLKEEACSQIALAAGSRHSCCNQQLSMRHAWAHPASWYSCCDQQLDMTRADSGGSIKHRGTLVLISKLICAVALQWWVLQA